MTSGVDALSPRALGEVPAGLGPAIPQILAPQRAAGDSERGSAATLAEATLSVREDVVFRLARDGAAVPGTAGSWSVGDGALPVAAIAELGSPVLAEALAAGDLSALLDALAADVVVIPVAMGPDGPQVIGYDTGSGPDATTDLLLFSSAASLERFVGDSDDRLFVIRHGVVAVEFAGRWAQRLDRVVFDPAGPHRCEVAASRFAAILAAAGEPSVDDVADEEPTSSVPGVPPVSFGLPLDGQWAVLDLTDESVRDAQIEHLVKRQTASLSDSGASLRRDLRHWLRESSARAATAGGRQYAFLRTRTARAAAAVSLVSYWHDLGPALPGRFSLDRLAQQLLGGAGQDDELVRLDVDGDRLIRHTRVSSGNRELGGEGIGLLVIDYWIEVPGSADLAHVSFSSPQLDVRDALVVLADSIVLNGEWQLPGESAADPRP